jgi:hypothetical protein
VSFVTETEVDVALLPAASLKPACSVSAPSAKPSVEKPADHRPELQVPPTKLGAAEPLTLRVTLRPFSEQLPDTAKLALFVAIDT